MSLGFSEIIRSIEAEIKTEYLPGAITWADKHHNNAWSNAIDRFDRALSRSIERQDYTLAKLEGEHYRITVLDLLRKYKKEKGIADTDSFLTAIGAKR